MYQCSICGLNIGPEDATEYNEPSRPCDSCRQESGDEERRDRYPFAGEIEDDE
jgi:hypothetical protein